MWPKLLILLIGGFLRFYKLDWGEGYFFHPDERNVAHLAASIAPPLNFNFFTQGTFAYGSLMAYLVFGLDFFRRAFLSGLIPQDSFTFSLLALRVISSFFSTLTIFLIYLVGEKFWNKKVAVLAASFLAFSPGAIQAAHFGTAESILSFLYLLVFFLNLRLFQKNNLRDFFLALFFAAAASAIKINSLVLVPLSVLILFFSGKKKYRWGAKVLVVGGGLLVFSLLVLLFSPYYLTSNFKMMFDYEQQLVRGKIDVFYTRQFFETKPVIFQFLKILPFVSNPLIVFLFPFFIVYYLLTLIQKSWRENRNVLFLLCFWGAFFLPNALLFTKWTRYMIPTLPFLTLLAAVFIEKFVKSRPRPIFIFLILTSLLWGIAFTSIYYHQDTRLAASAWIYQSLENNSFLLSETANVIDIPLPPKGKMPPKTFIVKNFDFYHFEKNQALIDELLTNLEKSDYILIPSRRLFGGMGRFPQKYPLVNRYYQLLFSGELGFEEIKRFTSYPRLWFLEFPDERAEETWSVFDHPVIRIYRKVKPFSKNEYEKLLQV